MFCETCGQKNGDQAKFCRYCGSSFENSKDVQFHDVPSPQSSESIGFGNRNTGENLVIRCSLCARQDFAKDTGRLDSKWGFTSFKVVMLTCRHCGHIELFNKGRSIFDFD